MNPQHEKLVTYLEGEIRFREDSAGHLESRLTALRKEIEDFRARLATAQGYLVVYKAWLETAGAEQSIEERYGGTPLLEELSECRRQRDALKVIARSTGESSQRLGCREVDAPGRCSQGKLASATSSAYRIMNDSDEWEYDSPGTFRLKEQRIPIPS